MFFKFLIELNKKKITLGEFKYFFHNLYMLEYSYLSTHFRATVDSLKYFPQFTLNYLPNSS